MNQKCYLFNSAISVLETTIHIYFLFLTFQFFVSCVLMPHAPEMIVFFFFISNFERPKTNNNNNDNKNEFEFFYDECTFRIHLDDCGIEIIFSCIVHQFSNYYYCSRNVWSISHFLKLCWKDSHQCRSEVTEGRDELCFFFCFDCFDCF